MYENQLHNYGLLISFVLSSIVEKVLLIQGPLRKLCIALNTYSGCIVRIFFGLFQGQVLAENWKPFTRR